MRVQVEDVVQQIGQVFADQAPAKLQGLAKISTGE